VKSKKAFALGDLLPIGITFVVLTVALAVGLQITGETAQEMCVGGASGWNSTLGDCKVTATTIESNASHQGVIGLAKIPAKMPIIATVVVAAVIIGVLVRSLMQRM